MLTPVSSAHASQTTEAAQPTAPKPAQQQSNPQPSDKVTLKSAGDVDRDGDSK